jgi:hypothetical protein
MGILNHLLIALPSEADAVAACDDPSRTWDGFFFRGLDRIKLATLWLWLRLVLRMTISNSGLTRYARYAKGIKVRGLMLYQQPCLASLASLAAMEEDEQELIAERWGQTEELEGWEASEILDLVRSIGDTAETAQLEGKTLVIWTSL